MARLRWLLSLASSWTLKLMGVEAHGHRLVDAWAVAMRYDRPKLGQAPTGDSPRPSASRPTSPSPTSEHAPSLIQRWKTTHKADGTQTSKRGARLLDSARATSQLPPKNRRQIPPGNLSCGGFAPRPPPTPGSKWPHS